VTDRPRSELTVDIPLPSGRRLWARLELPITAADWDYIGGALRNLRAAWVEEPADSTDREVRPAAPLGEDGAAAASPTPKGDGPCRPSS
jgi:hypothetical protein